jgi:hypothetical protein
MPDGSLMKGAQHAKLPERVAKKTRRKSSLLTAFEEGGKRLRSRR